MNFVSNVKRTTPILSHMSFTLRRRSKLEGSVAESWMLEQLCCFQRHTAVHSETYCRRLLVYYPPVRATDGTAIRPEIADIDVMRTITTPKNCCLRNAFDYQ